MHFCSGSRFFCFWCASKITVVFSAKLRQVMSHLRSRCSPMRLSAKHRTTTDQSWRHFFPCNKVHAPSSEFLAHRHTNVCHWHTCATEVCQTKSSRSGLKLTLHRFSVRSDEVEKSWHTGTPERHQPCCTARPRRRHVSVRACGAHSVCGSSFYFSVKKEIQVCQCAGPEMTSAVGAGNLRKRTFRRFEFADHGTPAVGTGVPACASVPRCAKVGGE